MTVNKFFSLSLTVLLFLILISIPLDRADAEELDSVTKKIKDVLFSEFVFCL